MRVEILNTGSELMLGFVTNTRCAGAADDSVTGTLADVVQNVGSMTMMQVRDLALEQAMEIKPLKYKSTQLETATFTGTYTPTESDRFLVMFSDDGYKITVKLGGEEVFKQDALNRGQHLPNVDGNPSATRSLHLLPIVLEKGVTYEIEVVYRNKFYYGATDIDGITVFVVDSATEFEMCSAVCTPAGGMKPTTAVGDPHDAHIRARVDTDGRTRTYKVTFRAHNPPNGLVRVDDIEVEDLDGGLPILFFQKGTLNNHATFSVSSQVLPGAPNMLTKRLQVTVHFKGVNPGSVTLSFYDKRTERATDVGWELLRDNTAIPGDERKTWLVGTGEVAAVANAGVAVSGARAYLPRGGGTVEVVVKADLGAGVAHDVIENWPNNPDGDPWPVRVLWQSDAGTVTAVVRGRGTASTIFGAKPDFVGQATLSWVTGTSTNVATLTVGRCFETEATADFKDPDGQLGGCDRVIATIKAKLEFCLVTNSPVLLTVDVTGPNAGLIQGLACLDGQDSRELLPNGVRLKKTVTQFQFGVVLRGAERLVGRANPNDCAGNEQGDFCPDPPCPANGRWACIGWKIEPAQPGEFNITVEPRQMPPACGVPRVCTPP